MNIAEVVKLREEVVKGEIHGWDSLRKIFERGRESDPKYVFGTTYPTTEIRNLIAAINDKIKGERRTGLYEIMGGYGTGKSRTLCLIYHLFKNPEEGRSWLNNYNIVFNPINNVTVIALDLMNTPPPYLWEPIFKGLGKEELLMKKGNEPFPGIQLLKDALNKDGFTVIILDEVESWYKATHDKDKNLAFLQVLAEVACEEGSKLLVFCALYGEERDILAKLGRVEPYIVNLTLSEDRPKIILHRLIEEVDKEKALKIINDYIEHYRKSEVEIEDPPSYKLDMANLYPIHPELMETLLTKYSSAPRYQNTRGVLFLLGSALMKKCTDADLLLTSDIDMTEPDLLELDRVLVENAQKDAEKAEKKDMVYRKLLNTVLLHSFGEKAGASRNDVVLGILRPGMNINDILVRLENLPSEASHVWLRDEKYVIGREENIIISIQKSAEDAIRNRRIEEALEIIKAKLRKDDSYAVYHPNQEFSDPIKDSGELTIAISLKELSKDEVNEFYKGKQYGNRIILYVPKSGDITRDEDLLVIAERLRLCEEYEKKVSGENKALLESQRDRDEKLLREKIDDKYGFWVRVTGFKDGEIDYRLVSCGIDKIMQEVGGKYNVEDFKEAILNSLEEKGAKGLEIGALKEDFKIRLGKPIIITEDPNPVEVALKKLYEEDKIVVKDRSRTWHIPESCPQFKDDMQAVLRKFVSVSEPIVRKTTEETEEKNHKEAQSKRSSEKEERKEETVILQTSTYPTPYRLSEEIERKIVEGDQIRRIEISFTGACFPDFESLIKFVNSIKVDKAKYSDISLKLICDGPLEKKEVLGLIDKLPSSIGDAKIQAGVEVARAA